MAYYSDHAVELKSELAREVSGEVLRDLHRKRPLLHGLIASSLVAVLLAAGTGIALLHVWYLWLPLAVVAGFCIFNFTVLLHEVVHRAVLERAGPGTYRILGLLYAMPSGISASQFTKWHLDHHAELGSDDHDPKRHYLSPKRNSRWLKLLYFTPVLFAIYFRAAARETESYAPDLRKKIARERVATILFQLSILAGIALIGSPWLAFKLYVVPVFFVFPIAFALNRLGQHYSIDPSDPAQWSTLMKASWFWNTVYLHSNLHLEHHYFPGVPFYNLSRLQRQLGPFYERHGIVARGYGELLWGWIVQNHKPHSRWESDPQGTGVLAER